MTGRLLVLSIALASGVQAQAHRSPPSQGDVALSVGSVNHLDVGVRYWVTDGVSVGASWGESEFERVDEQPTFRAPADLEADAWTAAVSLEGDGILLGGRFAYAAGVQAFTRQQVSDVIVGYDSNLEAVVRRDGQDVDVWGAGFTTRFDLRLVGPVYIGTQGGLFGLRVVRTRGGTEVRDESIVDLEGETRTRLKLGGPGRFYLAVRL